MNPDHVQIENTWKTALAEEFEKPYFDQIANFLKVEKKNGKIIYPPGSQIFNAFEFVPFDQVKVVILGQDPYHRKGQAMGLSFSVPKGIRIPPSLQNIYKELKNDVDFEIPNHGDLSDWAEQGVFLLNAILTVEESNAGSHRKVGWQQFTDAVISKLSSGRKNIVFLLWGNFAKSKKVLVDESKHLVLEAPHPSPLARGGFFGCRHFSKCNDYLQKNKISTINWKLK